MTITLDRPVLDTRTETRTQIAHGPVAHIVERRPGDDRHPAVVILEARVEGLPVTALCGHTWVPSRDPKRLPLCGECEAIFAMHGDLGLHGSGDDTSVVKP